MELHALMLDYSNVQSFLYQRKKAIHHGRQAVLNYIGREKPQLSEYAKEQVSRYVALTLNQSIRDEVVGNISHEKGMSNFKDIYPFQSPTGMRVLIRSILDSNFAAGEKKLRAEAVIANYKTRKLRADIASPDVSSDFCCNRRFASLGASLLAFSRPFHCDNLL